MKLALVAFVSIFLFFLLALLVLGILRTWQVQHNLLQKQFLSGKVPQQMPEGLYKGTVSGLTTTWQGKKFDKSKSTGINVFKDNKLHYERYTFVTYVGNGVQDKHLKVLKIDYSHNTDPWWLKYILDEVVEVSPGKFLGKVHITLIPTLPLSLGYFWLEK